MNTLPNPDLSNPDCLVLRPFTHQSQLKRSSLLNRWIHDQQSHIVPQTPTNSNRTDDDESPPSMQSNCNPYLAYPHLSRASLPLDSSDEVERLPGYDLVNTDNTLETPVQGCTLDPSSPPCSPSELVQASSPRRNFRFSFRSSPSAHMCLDSPTPSRLSFFSRKSRIVGNNAQPHNHGRSSSLVLPAPNASPDACTVGTPAAVLARKWNVLGHFSTSSVPQISVSSLNLNPPVTPPRQSTSSFASDDEAAPETPHQTSFASSLLSQASSGSKLFKHGAGSASSPSLWSQPTTISTSHDKPPTDASISLAHKASTIRLPFSSKRKSHLTIGIDDSCDEDQDEFERCPPAYDPTTPYVAYCAQGSARLSLSSLSSSMRKKKRLVIRGIGMHEAKKFNAAKRWCESFGEVSQITRVPNGDLHVHFASAEVADTVCRLRAKVFIAGVGSVYLSWYAGNKL